MVSGDPMIDPWVQWANDKKQGRDPSRAIADEVKRQTRAMWIETFVAIGLAIVVGTRVVVMMGHHARGFVLVTTGFLTVWTTALAITLLIIRRGTFLSRDESMTALLELTRRRFVSQQRLILPMRIAIAIMAVFLAVWLPWLTWFAPHVQRQTVVTGLVRMSIAAALVAFLFAVLTRLATLTHERIVAVDALLAATR